MPAPPAWHQMELYFPCCHDAFRAPRAPSKNQQRTDKSGSVPIRGSRRARPRAAARHGRGGLARCLASLALLVSAACSGLAEIETSGNYSVNGGSGAGNSPRHVEPAPASPVNAGNPVPTSGPGGDPDGSGENQGPGATETKFSTLPCSTDAGCGGSRCLLPASPEPADAGETQLRSAPDAGAQGAGASGDVGVTHAGLTDADAGNAFPLGRCSPAD
jgi:hypothetical protein